MRSIPLLALVAASLAAGPALAQSYKLDKIEINGLKSVSPDGLRAALHEKPGDTVTVDSITADQDVLVATLQKSNVTGGVKTSMRNKNNGHIDIIFDVNDNGVQAPVVVKIAPKLQNQVFTGNVALTADQLIAATGLKPGEELNNDKITAAQQGIVAAYKAVKNGPSATIGAQVKQNGAGVEIDWTIEEKAAKKKKRNTEDLGGFKTDAE